MKPLSRNRRSQGGEMGRMSFAVARGVVGVLLGGLLVIHSLEGCGKKGSPIPPEDIGVAAKLERERQQAAQGARRQAQQVAPAEGERERPPDDLPSEEDVQLPPLRPIGTQ